MGLSQITQNALPVCWRPSLKGWYSVPRRIIIDCDPGIDDALALLYAARSPESQLDGVTVVAGNTTLPQAVSNALRVLDLAEGRHVPVYAGASEPLERRLQPSARIHGDDGLGDCGWPASSRESQTERAAQFLNHHGQKFGHETTLICLGPLTNIAQAIRSDPESMSRYQRLVIMGGAYRVGGNASPVAEHNFWSDPEAAQAVLEWQGTSMRLLGLDIVRTVLLTPNHRELLRQMNTELTHWVCRSTRYFLNAHWQVDRILGCYLADPLAVAAALRPEWFDVQTYPASVAVDGLNRGQLVLNEFAQSQGHEPAGIEWCVAVKRRAFMEDLLACLGPVQWTSKQVRRCLIGCSE